MQNKSLGSLLLRATFAGLGGSLLGQLASAFLFRYWLMRSGAPFLGWGMILCLGLQMTALYGCIAWGITLKWTNLFKILFMTLTVLLLGTAINSWIHHKLPIESLAVPYVIALWVSILSTGYFSAITARWLASLCGLIASFLLVYPVNIFMSHSQWIQSWINYPTSLLATPANALDGLLSGLGLGLGIIFAEWFKSRKSHVV